MWVFGCYGLAGRKVQLPDQMSDVPASAGISDVWARSSRSQRRRALGRNVIGVPPGARGLAESDTKYLFNHSDTLVMVCFCGWGARLRPQILLYSWPLALGALRWSSRDAGEEFQLGGVVEVVAVGVPGLILGGAGRAGPAAFAGGPPTPAWGEVEICD